MVFSGLSWRSFSGQACKLYKLHRSFVVLEVSSGFGGFGGREVGMSAVG